MAISTSLVGDIDLSLSSSLLIGVEVIGVEAVGPIGDEATREIFYN